MKAIRLKPRMFMSDKQAPKQSFGWFPLSN